MTMYYEDPMLIATYAYVFFIGFMALAGILEYFMERWEKKRNVGQIVFLDTANKREDDHGRHGALMKRWEKKNSKPN